jgi:hypothetical protein
VEIPFDQESCPWSREVFHLWGFIFFNMEGWIKLHRKLLDWQWLNKPEMVSIFIYCLLKANHNGNFWREIEIKRGQFITSPEKISHELGISYQTVRTSLERLQNTHEINKQTTNKYTLITVLNYDSYQQEEQTINKRTNKQLTNNQQTTNKQLTTNKNDKNDKKEIYTYSNFYDLEIKKANELKNIEYPLFVAWLFKNNINKSPLNKVLSMKDQISVDLFDKYINTYGYENFKNTILNLENYNKKIYTSFNLTLNNWLKDKNNTSQQAQKQSPQPQYLTKRL